MFLAPWRVLVLIQVGVAVKRKARQKPCKSRRRRGWDRSHSERMESAACLRYGITTEWCMESTVGGMESRPKGRGDARQAVMPYGPMGDAIQRAVRVDSLPKT